MIEMTQLQEFEKTIRLTKEAIAIAEKELLVEETKKEQYEKQLKELEEKSLSSFGVTIGGLQTKINQKMAEMQEINARLSALSNLSSVSQSDVDELF